MLQLSLTAKVCRQHANHVLQILIYGACDRPGPGRDDIALLIQVGLCLLLLVEVYVCTSMPQTQ